MRAATAANTDPKEKKMESAVTRCFLLFGSCSKISVPSVGIDPYAIFQFLPRTRAPHINTYSHGTPQQEKRNA